MVNAGVLFSEWGMTADSLMNDNKNELEKKSLKCEVSCAVKADYIMFNQVMKVRYWFTGNYSENSSLKEIWMNSEEYDGEPLRSDEDKEKLFSEFKKLYTARLGSPSVSYKDDTMRFLDIKTYSWDDKKRKNKIQLEMWIKNVRVKYAPLIGFKDSVKK